MLPITLVRKELQQSRETLQQQMKDLLRFLSIRFSVIPNPVVMHGPQVIVDTRVLPEALVLLSLRVQLK